MRALNHILTPAPHSETGVSHSEKVTWDTAYLPFRGPISAPEDEMYAACMRPYSLPRKVSTFALLLRFLGVSQRIPKSGCDEHLIFKPLFREQRHRLAVASGLKIR